MRLLASERCLTVDWTAVAVETDLAVLRGGSLCRGDMIGRVCWHFGRRQGSFAAVSSQPVTHVLASSLVANL